MNARIIAPSAALALVLLAGGCMQEGKTWYGADRDTDTAMRSDRSSSRSARYDSDYNSSTGRYADQSMVLDNATGDVDGDNDMGTGRTSYRSAAARDRNNQMDNATGNLEGGPRADRDYTDGDRARRGDQANRDNATGDTSARNRDGSWNNDNRNMNDRDRNMAAGGVVAGDRNDDRMWNMGNNADASILMAMHMKNQEEIAAGKLAQDRAENSQVKDFGKMLVTHHQENDELVMRHAKRLGVNLDDDADDKAKAKIKGKFAKVEGSDFDRMFAVQMRDGHRDTIRRVEAAKAGVQDQELKNFLDQTVPTLRQHEQTAARLAGGNADGSGTMHNHNNTNNTNDNRTTNDR